MEEVRERERANPTCFQVAAGLRAPQGREAGMDSDRTADGGVARGGGVGGGREPHWDRSHDGGGLLCKEQLSGTLSGEEVMENRRGAEGDVGCCVYAEVPEPWVAVFSEVHMRERERGREAK